MTLNDIGAWASKTFTPQQVRASAPKQKKVDFMTQVQQVIGQGVRNFQQPLTAPRGRTDYFNPTSNGGNNFWQSPVARGAANVQAGIERYAKNVPKINITEPTVNYLTNKNTPALTRAAISLPVSVAESILNAPFDYTGGIAKLGVLGGKNLRGEKIKGQDVLAAGGQLGEGLLGLSMIPGVSSGVKQLGKKTFVNTVKAGAKGGAKYGAKAGAAQGLQDNASKESILQQLLATAPDVAGGAIGGAILGGGLAGGAYAGKKGYQFAKQLQARPDSQAGFFDFGSFFKPKTADALKGKGRIGEIDRKFLMSDIKKELGKKKEESVDDIVKGIVARQNGPNNVEMQARANAAKDAFAKRQGDKLNQEMFAKKGATYIEPPFTDMGKTPAFGMSVRPTKGSKEVHLIEKALKAKKITTEQAQTMIANLEQKQKNIKIVPEPKLGLAQGDGVVPPKSAGEPPFPWSEWDPSINKWVDPTVPAEIRAKAGVFKGEQYTKAQMKAEIAQTKFNGETEKKAFEKSFSKWVGKRSASDTIALEQTKDLAIPKGVDGKELIKEIETPSGGASPQVKAYKGKLRTKYDEVFKEAKAEGIDIGYRENYLTHIWDKPADEVARLYRGARQNFAFAGERQFPTYEEGIMMELKPKYSDPQQIIANYVSTLEKTKANIELIRNLKADRLIVAKRVPGFEPITAPGFPAPSIKLGDGTIREGVYYAPSNIAQSINKVFGEQKSILDKPARVAGGLQDLTLSGGVPKTPLNAWTFAQTTKEVLGGRIQGPLKALVKSMTPGGATKYFKENSQFIKEQQLNNIPINTTYNIDSLAPRSVVARVFGKDLGDVWHKTVNEATFKKFMPILQTEFYKNTKTSALKSGLSEEAAQAVAAKATKNWYGLTSSSDSILRDQGMKDFWSTVAFAPRYRETMAWFWTNNLKSLKNPLALENRANVKFLIGAIATYGIYDQLNKQYNNGKAMIDNPPGTEDKLLIPQDDGTIIGVPFLSSIATIPRAMFREGKMVVAGDLQGAAKDALQTYSSMLIKPLIDVIANEDYFGKEITQENQTPNEKRKAQGKYLISKYISHPYLNELFDKRNTNDPAYQRISRAMEAPFRFYTQASLDTKEYFAARDASIKGLSSVEQSALASIPKSDGNDPQTRITKYNLFLSYPKVFEAKQKIELEVAAKTNKQIDPLYLFDYEMVKKYMRYESLPEGSQDRKDMIAAFPEVLTIIQSRGKFFDENPIPGQNNTSKRPEASDYVQKQMDAKNWKDPEVRAYLDANTAWNNDQRAKLGLPPLAGFTPFAKWPKKKKTVTFKNIKIKQPAALKFKKTKLGKLTLPKQPKTTNIKIKTPKSLLTSKSKKTIKIKTPKLA